MKAFPSILYQLSEASPYLLHCPVGQIQEKNCSVRFLHIAHFPHARGILAHLCKLAAVPFHGDLKILITMLLLKIVFLLSCQYQTKVANIINRISLGDFLHTHTNTTPHTRSPTHTLHTTHTPHTHTPPWPGNTMGM